MKFFHLKVSFRCPLTLFSFRRFLLLLLLLLLLLVLGVFVHFHLQRQTAVRRIHLQQERVRRPLFTFTSSSCPCSSASPPSISPSPPPTTFSSSATSVFLLERKREIINRRFNHCMSPPFLPSITHSFLFPSPPARLSTAMAKKTFSRMSDIR